MATICKPLFLLIIIFSTLFSENFLQNGNFENKFSGWRLWGGKSTRKSFDGKSAAVVSQEKQKWSGLEQTIKIPSDVDSVEITGWMKCKKVKQGQATWEQAVITLEFLDGCGNLIKPYPPSVGTSIGTTQWQEYKRSYILNSEYHYIKLVCALGNATGTAYFDNLSISFYQNGKVMTKNKATYETVPEDYGDPAPGKQVKQKTKEGNKYLLYLPSDYDPAKKWPLVLFLHGAGERGDCLSEVEKHGPPSERLAEGKELPFIMISPLCPLGTAWQDDLIEPIYQEVIQKHSVDMDRITITGLSMGGFGTMEVVSKHPDRFAAYLPVAGGFDGKGKHIPENICDLKDTPAWFIVGAKDDVVLPERSEKIVKALEKCGGSPLFTLYPDADHVETFKRAYKDPKLYEWLMEQRK